MRAVQKAIKARLEAASVSAPIYDGIPASDPYPRIEFGPVSGTEANADCIVAQVDDIQLDIWDRSDGKLHPCKLITDEVVQALNAEILSLDDPYGAIEAHVLLYRVFPEPDGRTAHGVVQVRIEVQDTT